MSKSNKADAPAPVVADTTDVVETAAADTPVVVVAVNKVVYGARQVAPAGTIFTLPSSTPEEQATIEQLRAVGAVREPTDSELAVAGVTLAAPTDDIG